MADAEAAELDPERGKLEDWYAEVYVTYKWHLLILHAPTLYSL